MNSIIPLLVAVIMIVAFSVVIAKAQRAETQRTRSEPRSKENLVLEDPGDETWPFFARKALSQPEQVLYFRLTKALPNNIVLAQVQLSRLLGVKKGNNYQAWFNRINRLSADFVVCNKDSSVVAVIELDDASHEREDRQATDAKKDKALNSAGIRIIRWQTKALPDEGTIRMACLDAMVPKREGPPLVQVSA